MQQTLSPGDNTKFRNTISNMKTKLDIFCEVNLHKKYQDFGHSVELNIESRGVAPGNIEGSTPPPTFILSYSRSIL
jgi:hypothetical protein